MQRLKKIGEVKFKHASEVSNSRLGIGFEKLDRGLFDPEKAYDKVAALGVKWIRIQSGWARTEKKKGVYDFAWLDDIVDNLVRRGLRPWMCLCYGNPIYTEAAKEVFGAVGCPPIHTEEERQAWVNYVKATVTHFKDRITHYEVWNEPDSLWCWKHGVNPTELGVFNAATGKAVHEAFPEATVIGGVVSIKQSSVFLNEALATSDMAQHIDALSYHEYTPDESSVPFRVAFLRNILDKYKKGIKIIQGETGSQSKTGGHGAVSRCLWTEEKQAKQLLRHAAMDLSTEALFTSYFSCMDMAEALMGNVNDKASYLDFGYFGVLSAEFDENGIATGKYTPKKSYTAMGTLASVFAEDYELKDNAPFFPMPNWNYSIYDMDIATADITRHWYERENGDGVMLYWKGNSNILKESYTGTATFYTVTDKKITLIDLMTGDIYVLPEDMVEDLGYGSKLLKNIPVTDYPLALCFGDFYRAK